MWYRGIYRFSYKEKAFHENVINAVEIKYKQ